MSQSELGTANNQFGFDLYKTLGKDDQNIFFSPYSIYSAILMTAEGAQGSTQDEIFKALHSAKTIDAVRDDISKSQLQFNKSTESDTIRVANSIWLATGFPIHDAFESMVKDRYAGDIKQVDFAGETEKARITINDWVADNTNNRIKGLLAKGAVQPSTKLVLVNTVWFKGKWQSPFNQNLTRNEEFEAPGGKISTPFMHKQTTLNYFEDKTVQVIELPYATSGLSMVVLLPVKGQEAAFGKNLSQAQVDKWLAGLNAEETNISFPKFKMEGSFNLAAQLKALGIKKAFASDADFSGISEQKTNISDVIHKSFIEVDEEGTEAAAATSVVMVGSSMVKTPKKVNQFKADRPFLFLLRDMQSQTVLFIGKVTNPQKN